MVRPRGTTPRYETFGRTPRYALNAVNPHVRCSKTCEFCSLLIHSEITSPGQRRTQSGERQNQQDERCYENYRCFSKRIYRNDECSHCLSSGRCACSLIFLKRTSGRAMRSTISIGRASRSPLILKTVGSHKALVAMAPKLLEVAHASPWAKYDAIFHLTPHPLRQASRRTTRYIWWPPSYLRKLRQDRNDHIAHS